MQAQLAVQASKQQGGSSSCTGLVGAGRRKGGGVRAQKGHGRHEGKKCSGPAHAWHGPGTGKGGASMTDRHNAPTSNHKAGSTVKQAELAGMMYSTTHQHGMQGSAQRACRRKAKAGIRHRRSSSSTGRGGGRGISTAADSASRPPPPHTATWPLGSRPFRSRPAPPPPAKQPAPGLPPLTSNSTAPQWLGHMLELHSCA